MEKIIGAHLQGVLDSLDNWVSLSADTPQLLRGEIPADWSFLVKGPAAIYEAAGAEAYGQLLKPYRTTRQQEGREGTGWPMSAEESVGPAILINRLGKGAVLTYAASPDYAAASDHHIVEARKLLANAVHFLLPQSRVKIVAPCTVQSVVSDDPESRTLRIHLLGYNAPPQTTPAANRPYVLPALIEGAPMYRFRIECTDSIREVDTLNETTTYRKEENVVSGTINDIHEAVLIRY